jgi:hypothetical protein
VRPPLRLEDGSVVYNFCWSSPAQSFSDPSPVGLMTILYCLRFETPPFWRARSPHLYPPGTGSASYPPGTGFPFRRLLRLVGLRWRYSNLTPCELLVVFIQPQRGSHRKRIFSCYVFSRCRGSNVSTEPYPDNGSFTVSCLHRCYLAMCLHVTILIWIDYNCFDWIHPTR